MYTDASAIVYRAQTVWELESVPYGQVEAADCSAFVSTVLGIPRQSTVTLVTQNYIRPLARGEALSPGDFIGVCGPGTEGDAGHIAVVEYIRTVRAGFGTIEQVGPDGHLGPVKRFYNQIPYGFLPYRVTGGNEDMVLEISRDDTGTMWICRDRIDRRPLRNDEDVLYYLGRGALVPDQPGTAANGAPCVTDINLYGVDVSGATVLSSGDTPIIDPNQLAELVARKVGDDIAARMRA